MSRSLGGAAWLTAASLSACDLPGAGELGAAAEAATVAYCLLNVRTDNDTVHFEGPRWRLASSEGAGPLQLELRVLQFVLPAMSTSSTAKLDPGTVSAAVGYNVTERFGVDDFSLVTVKTGMFQRLEAYPAFRRTVFEIRDASCNVPLGVGAAYRPVGILFKVVTTTDVALPDLGVRVVEVLADGSGLVIAGGTAPSGGAGAGTPGAGTSGAGQPPTGTPGGSTAVGGSR